MKAPVRRLTALWSVVAFLALVFHGTTTASAATFIYDVPAVARVGVHAIGTDEANSTPLGHDWERSALPPSARSRGTATTPLTRSN